MRIVNTCLRVVVVTAVLMTAGSAFGQTWSGLGPNDNWNTGSNWVGGLAPGTSAALTFAGNERLTANFNNYTNAGFSIAFDAGAGAFELKGNQFTLGGNIPGQLFSIGFTGNPSSLITQTINNDINLNNSRAIATRANGNIVINGSILYGRANTNLTKDGEGVLTLSGTNTYQGITNVNAGTLLATKAAALPGYLVNQGVIVADGATLAVRAGGADGWVSTEVDSLLSNAQFKNLSTFATFGIDVSNGNSFTYGNNIGTTNANKAFVKTGAGLLTLSGNNTHTQGTTVNGGTLLATKAAALPAFTSVGKLNVAAGSTLAVSAGGTGEWAIHEIDSLLGTAAFQGGSTFGIDVSGGNEFAYANDIGNMQANKGFVKSGAGVLTLSGKTSYTGATNVNQGTLLINGDSSAATGAVTVAQGAILGGSGTIGGATTINGTLSPGSSPGVLTFGSSVTFASTGTAVMEIDGMAGAGLTGGHDMIVLTGANVLTYGGALTLDVGTTFGLGSYTWDLFDFGSETGTWNSIGLAGQYSGSLLDADTDGVWDLTSGFNTWQFTEGNGVLSLTVVPEPSTLALLVVAGVVGCGVRMRRRVRRSPSN